MNKTIEQMWQTAVVAAGNEKSFETTWGDVRDKFAKLLIERCANEVFFVYDGDESDFIQERILKLGELDES